MEQGLICEIIPSAYSIRVDFSSLLAAPTKPTNLYMKEDFIDTERAQQTTYPDSDADIIASKCAVIKEFKATGLHGNEPCWYLAMGVVRHCTDGVEKCHEYSAKDPDYMEIQCSRKISQLIKNNIGPTLCETFEQFGFCENCKHKGKIILPLQLGIKTEKVDIEINLDADRAKQLIKLAPIGKVWLMNKKGLYRLVDDEPVLLSDILFFITDLICEDFADETVLTAVITAFPKDKKRKSFKLPFKYLAEPAKLLAEFYARSIFPNRKWLKEYLVDYFGRLGHIVPYKTINSLGWQRDDSFIYNSEGKGYSTKTTELMYVLDKKMVGFVGGFEQKGSLEDWQAGIKLYCKDDIFMPHIFSLLCSLGAPLLTFTTAKGFILSLQGTSGSGKTLSHKYALSIWGNPESAGVIGTKDTHTARVGRMSAIKNLPLRMDEITTLAPAQLSGLIYELVNGRGRARATIDGSLSSTATDWQTVTLVTTNRPLLDNEMCILSEAERCRILELEVITPRDIIEVGKTIDNCMNNNYGIVGPTFMRQVVKHKQKVIDMISRYYDVFQYQLKEDKRFWATCGAVAFAAASVANHLKLFKLDIDRCIKWFFNVLKQQSALQKEAIIESRGFETREEFISALRDSINNAILKIDENGQPAYELNQPVKGRQLTVGKRTFLYVRTDIFKEFIRDHYTDSIDKVRRDLGIAKSKMKRFGNVVVRCYELELEN